MYAEDAMIRVDTRKTMNVIQEKPRGGRIQPPRRSRVKGQLARPQKFIFLATIFMSHLTRHWLRWGAKNAPPPSELSQ